MKKNKVISLIALLVASVLLLVGSVFAWFVIYDMMNGVDLTIAKIDSLITLYKGDDFDYDGNLNPPSLKEIGGVSVLTNYTWIKGPMPAIGNDITFIDAVMEIDDFMPSEIHTFKFHILNNSDARNEIRISFTNYLTSFWKESGVELYDGEDFDFFLQCLSAISVTVKVLEQDGVTPDSNFLTDKIYLANALQGKVTAEGENRLFEIDLTPAHILVYDYYSSDNDLEIQLIFKFEPYENLVKPIAEGGAGLTMSREDYEAFQGAPFVLPLLRIYLEIPYETVATAVMLPMA